VRFPPTQPPRHTPTANAHSTRLSFPLRGGRRPSPSAGQEERLSPPSTHKPPLPIPMGRGQSPANAHSTRPSFPLRGRRRPAQVGRRGSPRPRLTSHPFPFRWGGAGGGGNHQQTLTPPDRPSRFGEEGDQAPAQVGRRGSPRPRPPSHPFPIRWGWARGRGALSQQTPTPPDRPSRFGEEGDQAPAQVGRRGSPRPRLTSHPFPFRWGGAGGGGTHQQTLTPPDRPSRFGEEGDQAPSAGREERLSSPSTPEPPLPIPMGTGQSPANAHSTRPSLPLRGGRRPSPSAGREERLSPPSTHKPPLPIPMGRGRGRGQSLASAHSIRPSFPLRGGRRPSPQRRSGGEPLLAVDSQPTPSHSDGEGPGEGALPQQTLTPPDRPSRFGEEGDQAPAQVGRRGSPRPRPPSHPFPFRWGGAGGGGNHQQTPTPPTRGSPQPFTKSAR